MYKWISKERYGYRGYIAANNDRLRPILHFEMCNRPLWIDGSWTERLDAMNQPIWFGISAGFMQEGDGISSSISVLNKSLYLGLEGIIPAKVHKWAQKFAERKAEELSAKRKRKWYSYQLNPLGGRRLAVHITGAVTLDIWHNDHEWNSEDTKHLPWNGNGWHFYWNWMDAMFNPSVERTPICTQSTAFEFDGKSYSAVVTIEHITCKQRFLEAQVKYVANIAVTDPPRFAGKGENSYDCDDDCIYSSSTPYDKEPSVESVVQDYIAAVEERRRKYGQPRG